MLTRKYLLVPLALAVTLVCVVLLRLNEHAAYLCMRAVRLIIWGHISLALWMDARSLPSSSSRWILLAGALVLPVVLEAVSLTAQDEDEDDTRQNTLFQVSYFAYLVTLSLCFYVCVPLWIFRQGVKLSKIDAQYSTSIGSVPILAAFTVSLLFTQGLSAVRTWTGFDPLRFSVVVFFVWAGALLYEVKNWNGDGNFGSIMFMTWMMFGLNFGARGIFVSFWLAASAFPALQQLLVYFAVSFSFAILKLLWHATIRSVFSTLDAHKYTWAIILFEDLFLGFAFLGMDFNSPLFYVMLVLQIVKQLLRDTFFWETTFNAMLRRVLELPERTQDDEVLSLEERWRKLEQNLTSELVASVAIPLSMLVDIALPYGYPSVTFGMTKVEALTQVALYGLMLFFEIVMHGGVRWWFVRSITQRQTEQEQHRDSAPAVAWVSEEEQEEHSSTGATSNEGAAGPVPCTAAYFEEEKGAELRVSAELRQREAHFERGFTIAGVVTGLHTPGLVGREDSFLAKSMTLADDGIYTVDRYYENSRQYWAQNWRFFVCATLFIVFDAIISLSAIQAEIGLQAVA